MLRTFTFLLACLSLSQAACSPAQGKVQIENKKAESSPSIGTEQSANKAEIRDDRIDQKIIDQIKSNMPLYFSGYFPQNNVRSRVHFLEPVEFIKKDSGYRVKGLALIHFGDTGQNSKASYVLDLIELSTIKGTVFEIEKISTEISPPGNSKK